MSDELVGDKFVAIKLQRNYYWINSERYLLPVVTFVYKSNIKQVYLKKRSSFKPILKINSTNYIPNMCLIS